MEGTSSWEDIYRESGYNESEIRYLLSSLPSDDLGGDGLDQQLQSDAVQANQVQEQSRCLSVSSLTVNKRPQVRGPDKKPRKRQSQTPMPSATAAATNRDAAGICSSPRMTHLSDETHNMYDQFIEPQDEDPLLFSDSSVSSDIEDGPTLSRHAHRTLAKEAEWLEQKSSFLETYLIGWAWLTKETSTPTIETTCLECRDTDSVLSETVDIKLVTLSGFNASRLILRWCFHQSKPVPRDTLAFGLFPFSLKSFGNFITFKLLRFLSSMLDHSPASSVSVMAAVLSSLGDEELRRDNFITVIHVNQWRDLEHAERKLIRGDVFSCPACPGGGHCVHVDGNFKLYRYASQGRSLPSSNDIDTSFVAADQDVADHLHSLSYATSTEMDNVCGGRWRAAKNHPSRKSAKIDETGLEIASCRHDVALKALNMHRGEIFAYPLFLQLKFPDASFIAMDVVCKYYPWLKKTPYNALAERQLPLLSELHAKAHSWTCQLAWSARKQEGAGLSTGESTEHVNSYLSRHGLTTRQMSKPNRITRVTQAAAHWNTMKVCRLPFQLHSMYKKAKDILSHDHDMVSLEAKARLVLSVKETDDPLRREVEMRSANCQRLHQQITRLGDSAKMRARLKSKLSKAEQQLQHSISTLLQSQQHLDANELQVACRTGIYPWMKTSDVDVTFEDALKAYEQLNLIKRAEEELNLLKNEHSNAVKYFTTLKETVVDTADVLSGEFLVPLTELLQDLRTHFCDVMLTRLNHYDLQ